MMMLMNATGKVPTAGARRAVAAGVARALATGSFCASTLTVG
jgi:hypothetical protein